MQILIANTLQYYSLDGLFCGYNTNAIQHQLYVF